MIQIRGVPEDVHRTLKSRAALEGLSLSDYLKRDLVLSAHRPTMRELDERLRALGPSGITPQTVREALDEVRDA